MSTFTDTTKRPETPGTTPSATRPAQPTGSRTTTVLTSDCEFKGALAFSGELELHGRLEGTIESEGGALTVGEQALIKAEIKVNDVLIYGKVQGNIYATGRIELRGKAEVYGDLHSNRLAMDGRRDLRGPLQRPQRQDDPGERFREDVHPPRRDHDGCREDQLDAWFHQGVGGRSIAVVARALQSATATTTFCSVGAVRAKTESAARCVGCTRRSVRRRSRASRSPRAGA